jgi:hypothetical protein
MTPLVAKAIEEIKEKYSGHRCDVEDDGQGGAFVKIHGLPLRAPYRQEVTWCGFQIAHTYPYADVYPHFVRHDLSRKDGKALGDGTSMGSYRGEPAVQVSRRSNKLDPATDTALLKLDKVLRWLMCRT